ncbi:MAG: type II toxin-antitoxin system RelE/ParE family toxin [Proteobacteria bacterium]|nr:type II toxin-antitoxin system RelE/ParE family toxin [Pseudomonadota bacterium]
MIRSFTHKGLKRFAGRGDASRIPVKNTARVRRALLALDAASRPEDLNLPGFRFHRLKGDRAGTFSITISGNWRLTFRWDEGALDVDMEDYH